MMIEQIKEIVKTHGPVTCKDVKRELESNAIQNAYGITHLSIGQIKKELANLKAQGLIEEEMITKEFPIFK